MSTNDQMIQSNVVPPISLDVWGSKTFDKILNPPKAPPKSSRLVTMGLGEGVAEEKKVKKYMKQKIIKNGVTLKPGFQLTFSCN